MSNSDSDTCDTLRVSMAVELRHFRYFIAVAEERHFGRAARRLGIAQPPLSRQIQALEAELGVQLFERSRRMVELTSAGQSLLGHARSIFQTVDLALHEASRAARGEVGRLAVGYPSSVAYSGLVELLRAFRQHAPDVQLVLREMPPQDQIDALKDREIDVGFVRNPIADPALAVERVRSEPLVLAMPADHPLASRRRVPLELLRDEPFVSIPRQRAPAFFDHIMRICHEAGFSPRVVQEAAQLDLVSLVAAGFGVAIVPLSLKDARRGDIVVRPIQGSPTTELLVAWRRENASPALRSFLELVRKVGVRRGKRPARRA
jgi:DNA-binding transcriptional LysR family regulator